jgi:LmbE family N-acetylglucosaminyl deacetylase
LNVVAIGAHPDDVEFGCFGTLYAHRVRGDEIFEIILTGGELGGDPKVRKAEATNAARLVKAKTFFGGFTDGSLRDDHRTIGYIESILKEVEADVVYATASTDRHQDHRYASLASISAARFVNEVYEYETPSVVNTFSPRMYVDVTDGMDVKIAGIKCHVSQSKKRYLDYEAVVGLAKYRAYQAGLHGRMAEGFEVIRILKWAPPRNPTQPSSQLSRSMGPRRSST